MEQFKEMYFYLFNAATDAIALIDNGRANEAKEKLLSAQLATEDVYMSAQTESDVM
ncbi:MAG: hypothetical protein VB039_06895 [Oscillospiraceae bacterium]|nr:hypothetical protein [Oscillospiraceae bacterium]